MGDGRWEIGVRSWEPGVGLIRFAEMGYFRDRADNQLILTHNQWVLGPFLYLATDCASGSRWLFDCAPRDSSFSAAGRIGERRLKASLIERRSAS